MRTRSPDITEQANLAESQLAAIVDASDDGIITQAYEHAREILTRYRQKLDELSERLIKVETIDATEFEALFADQPRAERPGWLPIPAPTPA